MRIVRFPMHINDGMVSLRPFRIPDGPFLYSMLIDSDVLSSSGLDAPCFSHWIPLWWWMRKRYDLLFTVIYQSERAGVIGIYNLIPGQTGELSLVIPDRKKRRYRVGSRAFHLFERTVRNSSMIRTIMIRVRASNSDALSFWESLGFMQMNVADNLITLSLQCKRDSDTVPRKGPRSQWYALLLSAFVILL